MGECELFNGCMFYNNRMADMPVTADLMKNKYCRGDKEMCARYRVCKALGREKVPPNLFPNEYERAKELVSGR